MITGAPYAAAQSTGKQTAPDDERFIHLKIPRKSAAPAQNGARRGVERDNANARRMWELQRMAGLGGRDYMRHVLREADKQRASHAGLAAPGS